MRPIDADVLIAKIEAHVEDAEVISWTEIATSDVIRAIKNAPTIELERKRGRWLNCSGSWYGFYRCSECAGLYARDYDFCPQCGAQMEDDNGAD